MSNWIITQAEKIRIRLNAKMFFIMFNVAKKYMLSSTMELVETLENKLVSARNLNHSYNYLKRQEIACYYSKDEFGIVTKFSAPLISADLLSQYNSLKRTQKILLVVFTLLEASFFYLIIEQIVGPMLNILGENDTLKSLCCGFFSVILALLCAFMLDKSFAFTKSFLKARIYYKEKIIRREVYNDTLFNFILGIICFATVFFALLYVNIARSYALDSPQATANGSIHNPHLGTALVFVSIAVAVYIGIIKLQLSEISPKMVQNNQWKEVRKQMSKQLTSIETLFTKFENLVEVEILTTKQLTLDLRRTLHKEFDDRDKQLFYQYITAGVNSRNLNIDLYEKYEHLITCNDELIDFGMRNTIYSKDAYLEIKEIRNAIKNSENGYAKQLTLPNQATVIEQDQKLVAEPKQVLDDNSLSKNNLKQFANQFNF